MKDSADIIFDKIFNVKKNVILSMAAFCLVTFSTIGLYSFVLEHWGVETLGEWSIAFAIASLLRAGDLGFSAGLMKELSWRDFDVSSEKAECAKYLTAVITMGVVIFAVLSTLLLLLSPLVLKSVFTEIYSTTILRLLPGTITLVVLSSLALLAGGMLKALHKGFIAYIIQGVAALLALVLGYLLIPSLGLVGLLISLAIQSAVMLAVAAFVIWTILSGEMIRGISAVSASHFGRVFWFGLNYQVAAMPNMLLDPVAKIFLGQQGNFLLQGVFEFALKLVQICRNLVMSAATALIPLVSSVAHNFPDQSHKISRTLDQTIILSSLVMFSGLLASTNIIVLFMPGGDAEFLFFLNCILCVGYFFNLCGAQAYNFSIAVGRFPELIFANWLSFLLFVGAVLLLGFDVSEVACSFALALGVGGLLVRFLVDTRVERLAE